MGQDEYSKYPQRILDNWEKLSLDHKFSFWLDTIIGKFSAYINQRPNYKKHGNSLT